MAVTSQGVLVFGQTPGTPVRRGPDRLLNYPLSVPICKMCHREGGLPNCSVLRRTVRRSGAAAGQPLLPTSQRLRTYLSIS